MIIYFSHMHAWVCVGTPQSTCRRQRTACRNCSYPTTWGWESNPDHHAQGQAILSAESHLTMVSKMWKRGILSPNDAVWHTWLQIVISPSLYLWEIRVWYTDGVLDSMGCGRIYSLCFNSYQSVSNVFMEKYECHLVIKLFLMENCQCFWPAS